MVQATALNTITVGLMVVIFVFLWRRLAEYMVDRNPNSGLGKAMAIAI